MTNGNIRFTVPWLYKRLNEPYIENGFYKIVLSTGTTKISEVNLAEQQFLNTATLELMKYYFPEWWYVFVAPETYDDEGQGAIENAVLLQQKIRSKLRVAERKKTLRPGSFYRVLITTSDLEFDLTERSSKNPLFASNDWRRVDWPPPSIPLDACGDPILGDTSVAPMPNMPQFSEALAYYNELNAVTYPEDAPLGETYTFSWGLLDHETTTVKKIFNNYDSQKRYFDGQVIPDIDFAAEYDSLTEALSKITDLLNLNNIKTNSDDINMVTVSVDPGYRINQIDVGGALLPVGYFSYIETGPLSVPQTMVYLIRWGAILGTWATTAPKRSFNSFINFISRISNSYIRTYDLNYCGPSHTPAAQQIVNAAAAAHPGGVELEENKETFVTAKDNKLLEDIRQNPANLELILNEELTKREKVVKDKVKEAKKAFEKFKNSKEMRLITEIVRKVGIDALVKEAINCIMFNANFSYNNVTSDVRNFISTAANLFEKPRKPTVPGFGTINIDLSFFIEMKKIFSVNGMLSETLKKMFMELGFQIIKALIQGLTEMIAAACAGIDQQEGDYGTLDLSGMFDIDPNKAGRPNFLGEPHGLDICFSDFGISHSAGMQYLSSVSSILAGIEICQLLQKNSRSFTVEEILDFNRNYENINIRRSLNTSTKIVTFFGCLGSVVDTSTICADILDRSVIPNVDEICLTETQIINSVDQENLNTLLDILENGLVVELPNINLTSPTSPNYIPNPLVERSLPILIQGLAASISHEFYFAAEAAKSSLLAPSLTPDTLSPVAQLMDALGLKAKETEVTTPQKTRGGQKDAFLRKIIDGLQRLETDANAALNPPGESTFPCPELGDIFGGIDNAQDAALVMEELVRIIMNIDMSKLGRLSTQIEDYANAGARANPIMSYEFPEHFRIGVEEFIPSARLDRWSWNEPPEPTVGWVDWLRDAGEPVSTDEEIWAAADAFAGDSATLAAELFDIRENQIRELLTAQGLYFGAVWSEINNYESVPNFTIEESFVGGTYDSAEGTTIGGYPRIDYSCDIMAPRIWQGAPRPMLSGRLMSKASMKGTGTSQDLVVNPTNYGEFLDINMVYNFSKGPIGLGAENRVQTVYHPINYVESQPSAQYISETQVAGSLVADSIVEYDNKVFNAVEMADMAGLAIESEVRSENLSPAAGVFAGMIRDSLAEFVIRAQPTPQEIAAYSTSEEVQQHSNAPGRLSDYQDKLFDNYYKVLHNQYFPSTNAGLIKGLTNYVMKNGIFSVDAIKKALLVQDNKACLSSPEKIGDLMDINGIVASAQAEYYESSASDNLDARKLMKNCSMYAAVLIFLQIYIVQFYLKNMFVLSAFKLGTPGGGGMWDIPIIRGYILKSVQKSVEQSLNVIGTGPDNSGFAQLLTRVADEHMYRKIRRDPRNINMDFLETMGLDNVEELAENGNGLRYLLLQRLETSARPISNVISRNATKSFEEVFVEDVIGFSSPFIHGFDDLNSAGPAEFTAGAVAPIFVLSDHSTNKPHIVPGDINQTYQSSGDPALDMLAYGGFKIEKMLYWDESAFQYPASITIGRPIQENWNVQRKIEFGEAGSGLAGSCTLEEMKTVMDSLNPGTAPMILNNLRSEYRLVYYPPMEERNFGQEEDEELAPGGRPVGTSPEEAKLWLLSQIYNSAFPGVFKDWIPGHDAGAAADAHFSGHSHGAGQVNRTVNFLNKTLNTENAFIPLGTSFINRDITHGVFDFVGAADAGLTPEDIPSSRRDTNHISVGIPIMSIPVEGGLAGDYDLRHPHVRQEILDLERAENATHVQKIAASPEFDYFFTKVFDRELVLTTFLMNSFFLTEKMFPMSHIFTTLERSAMELVQSVHCTPDDGARQAPATVYEIQAAIANAGRPRIDMSSYMLKALKEFPIDVLEGICQILDPHVAITKIIRDVTGSVFAQIIAVIETALAEAANVDPALGAILASADVDVEELFNLLFCQMNREIRDEAPNLPAAVKRMMEKNSRFNPWPKVEVEGVYLQGTVPGVICLPPGPFGIIYLLLSLLRRDKDVSVMMTDEPC